MRDKRFSFCASAAFLCRFRPPPPPKCNFSSLTDFPQPQRLRKSAPKSFPPLIIFVKRPVVVQLQQQQQKIFRNFLSKGYGCVPRPPWPPRAGPTSRYLAPHVKTCVQKPHARACNLKSVRFARGWSLLHTGHLLNNTYNRICSVIVLEFCKLSLILII